MVIENYEPKRISELDLNLDKKVCIVGNVEEMREDCNFILNDGNGKIEVVNDQKLDFLQVGNKVRVFATNFEGKIKADIIQDMKNLDLELFNKVLELYKKAGL